MVSLKLCYYDLKYALRHCFISLFAIELFNVCLKPPQPNCQALEIKDPSISLKYYENTVFIIRVVYVKSARVL